ncbi:MAG: ABC transporter ATP-binding protein [Acidobacteria bacterium]|nr:ABC transporter ATP-binding protein [Acidobacteriota bacterium]
MACARRPSCTGRGYLNVIGKTDHRTASLHPRPTGGKPPLDPKKKPKLDRSRVYRDLKELVWPRRGKIGIGLVLIMINRVAGLVLPGSTKFLIDDVVGKRNLSLLGPLAMAVLAAVFVQAITSYTLTQLLSKAAQRLIADLRMKVQEHIGRLSLKYYDANKTGALLSRIMNDVEGVRNLIGTGLVELLGGLLTAVLALGLLLKINATLTAFALIAMALFGLLARKAFAYIRPIFRERNVINAEVSGRLSESLSGVRVVKGFHAESREAEIFARGAMRLFDNVKKSLTATSLMGMASTLLMGLVMVGVMVVGGRLIVSGEMTLGDFFAYTLYLGFLIAPVIQVVSIGSQITEAFAGLDRMHEVMSETPEDVDPERVIRLNGARGHIQFDDITFEYEPGKPVLKGVTLEALPGSVTALVGPSGSGKSTLIGLVAAFAKPTGGVVTVDGVDLSHARLDSYRSTLGVVLQENFLFDGSIRENILFGRPEASDEQMARAAQIAYVDEFALKLEQGYDTIIGERGVKLSGGQRQRVAIARAILADPRILILDEATSSLDTESEALIQQGLAALMKGRTTFVIAHRLSTIRSADQILVLEDGRITERGTHAQLMSLQGRYFDLYTRQAGIEANRFVNPGEFAKESESAMPPAKGTPEAIGPLEVLSGGRRDV